MNEDGKGPLSLADLEAAWEATNDRGFTSALQEAGEGNGYEAWTQLFTQLARVSEAADRTFQSLYILPHSGQTNEPSSGGEYAVVNLTLVRTGNMNRPLVLAAGATWVDENATDMSDDGSVQVLTGRRYMITESAIFVPGFSGPVVVEAQAERFGYGYNNPLPGTISFIEQPGTNFANDGAKLTVDASGTSPDGTSITRAFLDVANESDVLIPDHVGQYILFTSGANSGKFAQITTYQAPDPKISPPTGGRVELDLLGFAQVNVASGPGFNIGEILQLTNSINVLVAFAQLVATVPLTTGATYLLFRMRTPLVGTTVAHVFGQSSSTTANVTGAEGFPDLVSDADVSWRILDWVTDWGVVCSNEQSPSGGRAPTLDALGRERSIDRSPSEATEPYRARVSQPADTVTPNAIKRAIARVIGQVPYCFRESGTPMDQNPKVVGMFFDKDPYDPESYAIDIPSHPTTFETYEKVLFTDSTGTTTHGIGRWLGYSPAGLGLFLLDSGSFLKSGDYAVGLRTSTVAQVGLPVPTSVSKWRWRRWLSFENFRGYFFVGLPFNRKSDFGFAYDHHPHGAYDASPRNNFFDGFSRVDQQMYKALRQELDRVKLGGVGFQIYIESGDCS